MTLLELCFEIFSLKGINLYDLTNRLKGAISHEFSKPLLELFLKDFP